VIKKNDKIELQITDVTFDGLGVAKYSDSEANSFVIFVKNAIIGDHIDCHITKVLAKHAYGIIDRIIQPSPDRINPACGSFTKCGGCTYLNTKYESELIYKHRAVKAAFRNNYAKPIPEIAPVVPSPQISGYRNKVQYPISQDGVFSFYAKRSHRPQRINGCLLQPECFEAITSAVENYISSHNVSCYNEETGNGLIKYLYIRRAPSTGETMVCIVINGKNLPHKEQLTTELSKIDGVTSIYMNINTAQTNVILGKECVLLWGSEYITDVLCGLKFRISPLSFYQINSQQAERIYTDVAKKAGIAKDDVLLDLYCGIGTIGLSLASKVKKVIGIEIVQSAVENAYDNAFINKIKNADFFCSDASNALKILTEGDKETRPTAIIVDPPRKGLDAKTIAAVKEFKPRVLAYISCNPPTQARDLALINDNDEYEITDITPYDMFPRTGHVENLLILKRKD